MSMQLEMPWDLVPSEASEYSAERYNMDNRRNRGPEGMLLRMQQS